MFEKIAVTTLLITLLVIAGHYVYRLVRGAVKEGVCPACAIMRLPLRMISAMLLEQKLGFLGRVRKLVLLVGLLCFAVLAVTGFWPPLAEGEYLAGYMLMIHATFAPVLAICLAVAAVMYAYDCRFEQADWKGVLRLVKPEGRWEGGEKPAAPFLQRILFWVLMILSLPLMLSIALSMFPLFGTEMQEFLFEVHRYTALTMLICVLLQVYLAAVMPVCCNNE
ncbi:hypothetical protein STSP2_02461 [Anaerohalosphaera lusitana]|uniref:Uncharacterized protein n=1 Tax=Anaerohalosphaera lusitana TaxID=1936003 RepID=A0A1U9NMU6_9BACT|nr:hypothetical protein [Anaerohalosphaera lusitana]AQT69272.1 hypothetical protein STSP2_02461 [Anaerohalosphaera lusitana]